MQVIETNTEGLKREFKVVISSGQLAEKVTHRLAEVGRSAKIPGFRPGKVPMGILRKKFGQSVMGEVIEAAVNDATDQTISERQLRPALQPKVEITAFAEGQDLEFTVALETLPEVALTDLGSLSLEKPVASVSEAVLDEALQGIVARQEKTEDAPKKYAAKANDVVVIDFLGKVGDVAFDGGKAEGYSLKLGSNSFIPGFEDQLIGAKAGDERLVNVTFPAEYGSAELAGKDAVFEVKVSLVKKPVPAVLDDAMAKEFGFDDIEAFKTAVKSEIEREYADLSRAHVKRKLLDGLADRHDFAVPQGMVELEFGAIWKQWEKDKAASRIDPADEGKSEAELQAEYRAIADRRVRLGLVLSEIGRQNKLSITQDDLNRAVMNEARRFPGQEHMVFQYFQRNADAMESLKAPIFEEKVIDFILEMAKVTEKTVTVEELRADPDAKPARDKGEGAAKPKKKAVKKKAASSTEE
ncbi:MAG TPA: trigger factor [Rhodospirillaceae bacterium]|nr:trigger factor [Rhodospirillaceae bacterium]